MEAEAGWATATQTGRWGGWGPEGQRWPGLWPNLHPSCPVSASLRVLACPPSSCLQHLPPHPPVSNPLIIFATHCHPPNRAAAAPWVPTHRCLHCTPSCPRATTAGRQPGGHRQPLSTAARPALSLPGGGSAGRPPHPAALGQTLLRAPPAPGRGRDQRTNIPGAKLQCPHEAKVQGLPAEPQKKNVPSPRQSGCLLLSSSPGKSFPSANLQRACCSGGHTGHPRHSRAQVPEQSCQHPAPLPPPTPAVSHPTGTEGQTVGRTPTP